MFLKIGLGSSVHQIDFVISWDSQNHQSSKTVGNVWKSLLWSIVDLGQESKKKLQWPPMVGFGVPKKLRKMQRQAQDHAFRGMQVQLMSQIDET